nr:MAG TPA: hypothetical protein [Caudoviricetes sp.]
MNEDFYNSVHSELASEIGQKAVIIATLQTQVKNYQGYSQKLEDEMQELQKAKDEAQEKLFEVQAQFGKINKVLESDKDLKDIFDEVANKLEKE